MGDVATDAATGLLIAAVVIATERLAAHLRWSRPATVTTAVLASGVAAVVFSRALRSIAG